MADASELTSLEHDEDGRIVTRGVAAAERFDGGVRHHTDVGPG